MAGGAGMSISRISAATLDAIRTADIRHVLLSYGVKLKKNACHCPLHEDKHPSASIKHNYFHCFTCDVTLDSIGFIMRLDGCSFVDAVAKAAAIHSIPLRTDNAAESARYAAAFRAAQPEGQALYYWREDLLRWLRERRNASLELHHKAKAFIIEHSMEHSRADLVADIGDQYEHRYQVLDEQIVAVLTAKWEDLVPLYRRAQEVAA
jgi:DNA primase